MLTLFLEIFFALREDFVNIVWTQSLFDQDSFLVLKLVSNGQAQSVQTYLFIEWIS